MSAVALMPSASFAADSSSDGEVVAVTPVANQLVIDGVTYGVAVLPDFDPSRDVVIAGAAADSSAIGKSSPADVSMTVGPDALANQAGCSWYGFNIPGTGATVTSVAGCSYIGFDHTVRATYNWDRNFNSIGMPCMSGKGYYQNIAGTYIEYWGAFGCYRASGNDTVAWGNVASSKQMRGYTSSALVGWIGQFS